MVRYHDIEINELDTGGEVPHNYDRRNSTVHQGLSNVLANYNDPTLRRDAAQFAIDKLEIDDNSEDFHDFIRAAFVARDIDIYYAVARGGLRYAPGQLDVDLKQDERVALRNEKDKLFNEHGIKMVNLAVSLAAILQGHVQSSINGASLYAYQLGIGNSEALGTGEREVVLGAVNSAPFFTAAALGCWLALPANDRLGRRGSMMVSAVLIFISSLVAGLTVLIPREDRWKLLLGVRVINGIGMGIKAVSTPILASETAIHFWRGSFVLAWQLWVSFGIMIGFVFNLIFAAIVHRIYSDGNHELTVSLILGAPLIFAAAMLVAVWKCTESPRYFMRGGPSRCNPKKAYEKLKKLRSCKLLAMKDMYLLHKTMEQESREIGPDLSESNVFAKFGQLFTRRRLRNALISTSVVNLAQQLCGINVAAFYSGNFFLSVLPGNNDTDNLKYESIISAMTFSFGFGSVNFFFGLPAIKTIDTLGRRKWLIWTLPLMSFFMFAGSMSFPIPWDGEKVDYNTVRMVALWLYFHAATYSPGLGPIPFTLASESFPLSHRELGSAFAIAVNLGFAGLLTIGFPTINNNLHPSGSLGLFSGFNFVAFILVYLLVEETKELSLEQLSYVLNKSKRKFIQYQVSYANWFVRRYLMGDRDEMAPEMEDGVEAQQATRGRRIRDPEGQSFRSHSEGQSRISSVRSVSPRQARPN